MGFLTLFFLFYLFLLFYPFLFIFIILKFINTDLTIYYKFSCIPDISKNSSWKTKAISSTSMFPEFDLSFPVACLYIRILFRGQYTQGSRI